MTEARLRDCIHYERINCRGFARGVLWAGRVLYGRGCEKLAVDVALYCGRRLHCFSVRQLERGREQTAQYSTMAANTYDVIVIGGGISGECHKQKQENLMKPYSILRQSYAFGVIQKCSVKEEVFGQLQLLMHTTTRRFPQGGTLAPYRLTGLTASISLNMKEAHCTGVEDICVVKTLTDYGLIDLLRVVKLQVVYGSRGQRSLPVPRVYL